MKPRKGRTGCWAILPGGQQCPRERRTSFPYDGIGSRDGIIALCHGHKRNFEKYGLPRTDIPMRITASLTFEERVETYLNPAFSYIRFGDFVRDDGTVCFLWRGFTQGGYGAVNSKVIAERVGTRRNALTHRMVWVYHYGPIGKGMHIHHTCHETACCNIKHLQERTMAANDLEASTHSVVLGRRDEEIKQLKEDKHELQRQLHNSLDPKRLH